MHKGHLINNNYSSSGGSLCISFLTKRYSNECKRFWSRGCHKAKHIKSSEQPSKVQLKKNLHVMVTTKLTFLVQEEFTCNGDNKACILGSTQTKPLP
jgi:hypothetical protein